MEKTPSKNTDDDLSPLVAPRWITRESAGSRLMHARRGFTTASFTARAFSTRSLRETGISERCQSLPRFISARGEGGEGTALHPKKGMCARSPLAEPPRGVNTTAFTTYSRDWLPSRAKHLLPPSLSLSRSLSLSLSLSLSATTAVAAPFYDVYTRGPIFRLRCPDAECTSDACRVEASRGIARWLV